MKTLPLIATSGIVMFFMSQACMAAMILPNARPASTSEYLSSGMYARPMDGAGAFNEPYEVRRHHEEAYCSGRGLTANSIAFSQCVAQVDAALFDRQFPIR